MTDVDTLIATPNGVTSPEPPSKIKRFRLLPPPPANEWQPVNPGLSYRALLVQAIRQPLNPQAGVDALEMHKCSRLFSMVDGKHDNDIFECDQEADWAFLLEKVRAVRWGFFDPQIERFIHTVEGATAEVLD